MKIIDLLNKIANGEEVPKKIKTCDDEIFYYDETDDNEVARYKNKNDVPIIDEFYLNDEVEIIEEDKKIEKIGNDYYHKTQPEQNQIFQRKINEIIDYLMEDNK